MSHRGCPVSETPGTHSPDTEEFVPGGGTAAIDRAGTSATRVRLGITHKVFIVRASPERSKLHCSVRGRAIHADRMPVPRSV